MNGLPDSLADFGPAALAAVVVAVYLVLGEPVVGHVLHRRFEGRLRSDPGARRSFYVRLLILEWGLALLALVVWLAAPGVDAAAGRAALAAGVARAGDRRRRRAGAAVRRRLDARAARRRAARGARDRRPPSR